MSCNHSNNQCGCGNNWWNNNWWNNNCDWGWDWNCSWNNSWWNNGCVCNCCCWRW